MQNKNTPEPNGGEDALAMLKEALEGVLNDPAIKGVLHACPICAKTKFEIFHELGVLNGQGWTIHGTVSPREFTAKASVSDPRLMVMGVMLLAMHTQHEFREFRVKQGMSEDDAEHEVSAIAKVAEMLFTKQHEKGGQDGQKKTQ
jgi:hypothetical protein